MSKQRSEAEMIDDANPEWTEAAFERAMQIDGLPRPFQDKLRDGHCPQKLPRKVEAYARSDTDIIDKTIVE